MSLNVSGNRYGLEYYIHHAQCVTGTRMIASYFRVEDGKSEQKQMVADCFGRQLPY